MRRIFNIFKAKDPPPTTMREILGRDIVNRVLDDFIENNVSTADAIIIMWATRDEVFIDAGGFSEAEALGAMTLGQNMIMDKGITRR